jgi:ketosteroid isomerase-like protein
MTSIEEQKRIAVDYVTHVAGGGIDLSHYAPDLTAWTTSTGLIQGSDFLPRLALAAKIWKTPLKMTIDSVTAQLGRVVVQSRSYGVLFNDMEYSNDYLFMVEFNEDGLIRHVREYFNLVRLNSIYKVAQAEWLAKNAA